MSRSFRLAVSGVAVLLASAGAVAAAAGPAYAKTCGTAPADHCYGEVEYYSSSQLWGINQGLNVACLGPVSTTSKNFTTQEMWLSTANSNGTYWVEEGMAYGAPQGSKRYFFWADSRPNGGGYHEHDLSIAANLNQTYDDYITWNGSGWAVKRDGSTLGTSNANPGQAHYANAGEELTINSGASAGKSVFLYRQTSYNGSWTAGWGGGVSADGPPYGGWMSSPYSADFYSNCSFSAVTDDAPTFSAFSAAGADAAMTKVVTDLAVVNGGADPQSISYVKTTRQAASDLTGQSQLDSDQPVYLAVATGKFVGTVAKTPKGSPKPEGTTMTVAVDPVTGQITDWGIEGQQVSLSGLGEVHSVR